jgi:hypothetical protein
LESTALRLILPVKGCAGFGIYLPSIVVVALGEPGVPVVWTCALPEGGTAIKAVANIPIRKMCLFVFMIWFSVGLENLIVTPHEIGRLLEDTQKCLQKSSSTTESFPGLDIAELFAC